MFRKFTILRGHKFSNRLENTLLLLLALVGSIFIAAQVPWQLVFSTSIPTGGDNPAHPVLVSSLADSFFNHGSIIHYSDDFWGGFEVFQFYFPLSYFLAAFLGQIVHANIAFKLVTIIAVVLLPAAFFAMGNRLKLSVLSCGVASILAIPFLYTKAHVMWGGNIFSALAGMIGNSWAFLFFVISYGQFCASYRKGNFSLLTVVLIFLTAMSHFYGLLMLTILIAAISFDFIYRTIKQGYSFSITKLPFYLSVFLGFMSTAWWALPLNFYSSFSSHFAGDWDIKILETINTAEKITFSLAIVISIGIAAYLRFKDFILNTTIITATLFTLLYFSNHIFTSSAFANVRLWPCLYFSLYALLIVVFDRTLKLLPALSVIFLILFCYLLPKSVVLDEAGYWMKWNFSGIQAKKAGKDFYQIIELLKSQPDSSRVSFESNGLNNSILGSVRAFELIPLLSQHNIIEGGIVNSATFPGKGYLLQCLTSDTCAGWPPGSIMPHKDFVRAAEVMKMLGVSYHIALDKGNKKLIDESGKFDLLFSGQYFNLYKLKTLSKLVEVYEQPLPIIKGRPHFILLNLPRWDALRSAGYIFDWPGVTPEIREGEFIDTVSLFNFMSAKWYEGNRMLDIGWNNIHSTRPEYKILNHYLISWQRKFDLDYEKKKGLDTFIADRAFNADDYFILNQVRDTELMLPLMRDKAGVSQIVINGKGYKAFSKGRELELNQISELEFVADESGAATAQIYFKPIPSERYRILDTVTKDFSIKPSLIGGSDIPVVNNISQQCAAEVKYQFDQIELSTDCVGKPHLIKFSYYPKWKSTVPVMLSTNGFMTITPNQKVTVIRHESRYIDYTGVVISIFSILLAVWLAFFKSFKLH